MTTREPTLVLEGVSKWFGLVLALNEVSATFGPGVSGLLGPNGAGKSTLLNLACGLVRPSLGRVLLNGSPPFSRSRGKERLGFCPEHDATYPRAPIRDVVAYFTRLCGFARREARERADRTLERVGLGTVLQRSATTFSKGMRQRAKLALALAHDPDVVVLDEPLNGLDPTGRREAADLIRGLGEEGRCVLVSSHILHEMEHLTSRILLLHTGRVLAEGTVTGIREELPEHPLAVRIDTPTPAALARHLVALEGVRRVERAKDSLVVVTDRPNDLFDRVAAVVEEQDVEVDAVVPADEDLEAVFRYLTK